MKSQFSMLKFSWIWTLQLHLEAAQILQYTEDEFLQTLDWTEGGSNKKKQQLNANSPVGANQSASESMSEGISGDREDNRSAGTDSGEESENEAEEHSDEGEESSSG